jgi:hypothetical protein
MAYTARFVYIEMVFTFGVGARRIPVGTECTLVHSSLYTRYI